MDNILALILATAILGLIPGPNVALIVANSVRHGPVLGLVTVLGTMAGVAAQLSLVVFGLATAIAVAAEVLNWIKWAGVAYLLYLGIRTWHAPVTELSDVRAQSGRKRRIFWRGFIIAVLNPKTLLFNAAFLPQFLGGTADAGRDLAALACIFLLVLGSVDSLWALGAGSANRFLRRFSALRNKLGGGFLFLSGITLALTRRHG